MIDIGEIYDIYKIENNSTVPRFIFNSQYEDFQTTNYLVKLREEAK